MAKDKIKPTLDTSNVVKGLETIAANLGNIKDLAYAAGTGFIGWKVTDELMTNMVTTERQLIQMKTALQSATLGIQDYKHAMEFAARTPFPVEQVTQAAVMLRVFQFNPFEKVEGGARNLMEILGDMGGAMGRDVALAAHALNRAMVGEWEIMQNNFQISAKMIPKLKGLASGTKEYGAAIVEHLNTLQRFRGGMALTAKSIVGLVSNIEDAGSIFNTYVGGVVDAEQDLKGLTLYDTIRNSLQGMYDVVTDPAPLKGFRDLNSAIIEIDKQRSAAGITDAEYIELTKQMNSMEAERQRMLEKSGGRIHMWEQSIRAAGLASADAREQVNYLISTGQASTNDMMSQMEKIQMAGRITGQFFNFIYQLGVEPVVNGVTKLTKTLLNIPGAFLESVVPAANFTKSEMSNVTAVASNDIKKFMEQSTVYAGLMRQGSTKETEDMARDIRESFIKNQDLIMKQVQIFSIVMKFAMIFLQMEFEKFFKNNPLGIFLKFIGEVLWDVVIGGFRLAGVIAEEAFNSFLNLFSAFNEALGLSDETATDVKGTLGGVREVLQGIGEMTLGVFGGILSWINPLNIVADLIRLVMGSMKAVTGSIGAINPFASAEERAASKEKMFEGLQGVAKGGSGLLGARALLGEGGQQALLEGRFSDAFNQRGSMLGSVRKFFGGTAEEVVAHESRKEEENKREGKSTRADVVNMYGNGSVATDWTGLFDSKNKAPATTAPAVDTKNLLPSLAPLGGVPSGGAMAKMMTNNVVINLTVQGQAAAFAAQTGAGAIADKMIEKIGSLWSK